MAETLLILIMLEARSLRRVPRRATFSPACPRRPLALGVGGGGMPPSWGPAMAGSIFW